MVVVEVVEVVDDSSSKAEDKRAEDLGGGKDFEGDLEDRKVKTEVKLQDGEDILRLLKVVMWWW